MVHRPTKRKRSNRMSKLHGTQHPINNQVKGEQLGHDQQLPVNPNLGGSPIREPGGPDQLGLGAAMGNNPSGEEFY